MKVMFIVIRMFHYNGICDSKIYNAIVELIIYSSKVNYRFKGLLQISFHGVLDVSFQTVK